ncbi:ABC transporter substrate-binding protein [Nonomuraea diastatica]|uniref:ABC transporter substrate-binding protein n=1 Tax=Nonomuraea diastatica TaxID=1848329 RepID=A0A4R4WXK6_9ACTN|nr:ABC transporter substrate-binding protein [Nonomuraea diastatica]TDD22480.1 ABC transporter substrate-binding protein [Nonomuraea diastatica]
MKLKPLAGGLLAITLATVAGCSGSSSTPTNDAPDSGTITVKGYSGIFEDVFKTSVIEPFQKKHPKIKVNFVGSANSAENLASLRAARNSPDTDVSIMDVSTSGTGNKSEVFQPLDPAKVPNMKDIDPRGKVEGNFGPALTFDSLVLLYNDSVTPAPTTWDALWDPKYKGKVVVPAQPDIQGTGLMLIENAKAGGDYTKSVDQGIARLKQLAPNVQTWAPQPDSYTLVQSGTAALAVGWNARGQYYADESKGKLKVAIVDEQTIFQINTINLVKDSPSPAAAQTFINYTLSPESQEAFTEAMFYAPTNTKAKPSEEALKRTSLDPAKTAEILQVDWTQVAANREKWTQLWRREILAN